MVNELRKNLSGYAGFLPLLFWRSFTHAYISSAHDSSTVRWTCLPTGYQKTEEVFRNIQPENRRIWGDLPQDS